MMAMRTPMRMMRTVLPLLTLSALWAGAMGVARAQENAQQVTVPFSDPSRQGTLSIHLLQGAMTIRGTDRKDVMIEAHASEETRSPGRFGSGRGSGGTGRSGRGRGGSDDTGFGRLVQAGGFVVDEDNNQVVVASGSMNRGTDFTIQVPARTHLKLSANDGPIMVENVEGEIEVNNQSRSITLTNVAGSVVANAHNGKVKVIMTRLAVR
jgi:hypothetical protein